MNQEISENQSKNAFYVNRPVFFTATGLLLALVAFAALAPDSSQAFFAGMLGGIIEYASWYYVLVVAIILVSVMLFGFTRVGDIKLGPDHSEPEYSFVSWFAMMFAAGMGIGLMFYGVAEPVMHFLSPPHGEGGTPAAANEAFSLTFFHWGVHAWSIYAIVALILAYFAHRQGLPLTLRSALYPLIGERIYGPIGTAVDVFAILSTTLGVGTSLGLGVVQINTGLNYLLGIPIGVGVQLVLIVATMGLATISVVMGLDAGIKRLSEINIALAVILLVGVLITGPTVLILQGFMQNIGTYLGEVIPKTFNLYAYNPTDWLGGWTIFYWGWWLSWSPFVGLFIARISRGRTIREFVLGAMLVPCLFNLFWMSVFGNAAIEMILHGGATEFGAAVQENQAVALFRFFEFWPMAEVLSTVSIFMVVVFFVTSADSGAMVLNMLSSDGCDNTPALQRVYWTVAIALITMALLVGGGLASLQAAAIAGALPFSFALMWAIWGFSKALRLDANKRQLLATTQHTSQLDTDWKQRLHRLLEYPARRKVLKYQKEVVLPAMRKFAEELRGHDVDAKVNDEVDSSDSARLEVFHGGERDFLYEVICRPHVHPQIEGTGKPMEQLEADEKYYRAEVHLSEGGQDYCVMGWSEEHILADIMAQYSQHLQFYTSFR